MHRASTKRSLGMALALLALSGGGMASENSNSEEPGFRKSMDLLQAQMKLKTLQTLYEKGYYVPPSWVASYVEEQRRISEELDQGSEQDLEGMDAWVRETEKEREAEGNALLECAESWMKKAVKQGKEVDETYREFQQARVAWRKENAVRADGIALYVQQAAARLKDKTLGTEWEQTAREIYRGSLKDRDSILHGIVALEKEHMRIEGCLTALKEVEGGLKRLEALQEPDEARWEKVKEKLIEYLKANYKGVDKTCEANISWTLDKTKDLFMEGWGCWKKLSSLDEDRVLKANPTALKTAKGFAVLGSLYKSTLGIAKDYEVVKALGPLVDFLDFYGESISLVPDIAQKMQAMVSKMDQGYLGFRKLSAFGQLPDGLGPFWETSLMKFYGIQIAVGRDQMEGARGAHYILVVPKEMAPRGYAEFTEEQYLRLAQALTDERVLFAADEVSRSAWATAMDGLYGSKSDSALSSDAAIDSTYKAALGKAAAKTPFAEQDLQNLALGLPVTYKGREWTAAQFRERCEARMETLAEEMAVREALFEYSTAHREAWREFKKLLESSGVGLHPLQTLKLFNQHVHGGGARVTAYLDQLRTERAQHRTGVLRLGLAPEVYLPSGLADARDTVAPGERVSAAANAVVSDLAPGASVQASVSWELPSWAGQVEAPSTVRLANGFNTLACSFSVPQKPADRGFKISLKLSVPPGPGRPQALEKTASGAFEIVDRPTIVGTKVVHYDNNRWGTQLTFHSNAMADLRASIHDKPGTDATIWFKLYQAESPEGPWKEGAGTAWFKASRDADPQDPSLVSFAIPGQSGNRPLLYRIAYCGDDDHKAPQQEALSDPSLPPVPQLEYRVEYDSDWLQKDVAEVKSNADVKPHLEYFWIYLMPTVEGQAFVYREAHLTVTWGGRVWNAWTKPDAGYKSYHCDAPLLLPCRLGTHPLQISAALEGGGTISRTIQVTFNPSWAREAEVAAAQPLEAREAVAHQRKLVEYYAQEAQKAKDALPEARRQAQSNPGDDYWTGRVENLEWGIEYDERRAPEEYQEHLINEGMSSQIDDLCNASRFDEAVALRLQQAAAFPRILAQRLAWAERQLAHQVRPEEAQPKVVRANFRFEFGSILESGVKEAINAGDLASALFLAAQSEALESEGVQEGALDADHAARFHERLFDQLADGMAILGADREKAADLWIQARAAEAKIRGEDPSAKLKEVLAPSYSLRPDWWPPGKIDVKPAPPPTADELKALSDRLAQQAAPASGDVRLLEGDGGTPSVRPNQPPSSNPAPSVATPPPPTRSPTPPRPLQPPPAVPPPPVLKRPSSPPSAPPLPPVQTPPVSRAPSAEACAAGDAAYAKGDLETAWKEYSAVLKQNPANYLATVKRGHTQSFRRFYDWAIADYRKALALKPGPSDEREAPADQVRHFLADLLIVTGQLDAADKELLVLEKEGRPGAWERLLRGQYCLKKGDREAAAKALGEAVRMDPNLGKSVYDQAYRWIDYKQTDRALLNFDTLECMDPGNAAMFHYCRGQAYAAAGRKAEAIAAFRRYLELDPNGELAQQARAAIADLER